MRISSKRKLCKRANEIIDNFQSVTTRLTTLYDQGKIMGGCLMVHSWCNNHYYEELSKKMYGDQYKKTTERKLGVLVSLYEARYEEALVFVEQQESTSMENCQKARVLAER